MTSARQLLGIRHEIPSSDEVRGAWRRFALANHPDLKPGDPTASGRFAAGREAYEHLQRVAAGEQTRSSRTMPSYDPGVYRPSHRPGHVVRGVDAASAHPYAFGHVSAREWRA